MAEPPAFQQVQETIVGSGDPVSASGQPSFVPLQAGGLLPSVDPLSSPGAGAAYLRQFTRAYTIVAGTTSPAAPFAFTETLRPGIIRSFVIVCDVQDIGGVGMRFLDAGAQVMPEPRGRYLTPFTAPVAYVWNYDLYSGRLVVETFNLTGSPIDFTFVLAVEEFPPRIEERGPFGGLPPLVDLSAGAGGTVGAGILDDLPQDVRAQLQQAGITEEEAMTILDDILAELRAGREVMDEILFMVAGGVPPGPFEPDPEEGEGAPAPGPENTIKVPDVVGMRLENARNVIRAAGLEMETERASCAQPVGKVCRQAPKAGTIVRPFRKVQLTVSK